MARIDHDEYSERVRLELEDLKTAPLPQACDDWNTIWVLSGPQMNLEGYGEDGVKHVTALKRVLR